MTGPNSFEPVTRADWRERVRAELEDSDPEEVLLARTPSGLSVSALYDSSGGGTALAEGLRPTRGWRAAESFDATDALALHDRSIAAALLGIEVFRLAGSERAQGSSLAEFLATLADAPLEIARPTVVLAPLAAPFAVLAEAPPTKVELFGGFDPVRSLFAGHAFAGGFAGALVDEARFVREFKASGHAGLALEVDAAVLREAGGNAVDELAHVLASAAERLRAFVRSGGTAREWFASCAVRLAATRDLFEEVAKLRAARLVWAALAGACGVELERPLVLHCVGARRELAEQDAPTNAVRATAQAVAAALGGATTIELAPFEGRTPRAERLARTTHAVLQGEAELDAVDDPTGGAWYVEELTDAIARAAWAEFVRIEQAGGLDRCVRTGEFAARLSGRREQLAAAIAAKEHVIVGTNKYEPRGSAAHGAAQHERRSSAASGPAPTDGWPRLEPLVESALFAPTEPKGVRA